MSEESIYRVVAGSWLVLAAVVFVALRFITAPYGRFNRRGFGPQIDARLGWLVMEAPAALVMPAIFIGFRAWTQPVCVVFLALWELHYFYRAFVYPFRLSGCGRMPVFTVALAVVFNVGNGYLNGYYVFHLAPGYTNGWFADPRFIVGICLFAAGFAANHRSDAILRGLRGPNESGYKVPRGGLFEYVSAANYSGELIEWAGFALLTWSPGALIFLVWTAANLVPRARSIHAWYRETFPDYPASRKAIIPFLY